MDHIRDTFESAHKVLIAAVELMEAFAAFHHRIQNPDKYDGSGPFECRTPAVLFDRWEKLHALTEQLEIGYLYDPGAKNDILRALSSRPAVSVPAMLNVTAETHVEATCLIGLRIHDAITRICESMANSFDAIDRQPTVATDCNRTAKQLRDYGKSVANVLDYLRRALAIEEETCREFFNPVLSSIQRSHPSQWDKPTEDRNKWLYAECVKGTVYKTIIWKLTKKPRTWRRIKMANGIKKAAKSYADRKGLPPIPERAKGRPKSK